MADGKLGFIIGRMKVAEKYTPTQRRITKSYIPPRTPREHRKFLLESLSAMEKAIKRKAPKKVEGATNSLVAVKYTSGSEIKHTSLESKKDGIRVVYEIPEKQQILLDVSSQELTALRKKIEAYGEKPKISARSRDTNPKPANNSLVAPIERIEQAKFRLVWGLLLQDRGSKILPDVPDWFEISCRGGVHDESGETERSRGEITAALQLIGIQDTDLQEYVAPERVIFFVHCTLNQAKQMFELTDCMFEVELVPPSTLNWLPTHKVNIAYNNLPKVNKPQDDAPSAVILDSGINSKHPLLGNAVALEDSVHPEDPSPVDIIGHGTEMAGISIFGSEFPEIVAGRKSSDADHWIESVRVFTHNSSRVHSAAGRPFWAKMTDDAIHASETKGRKVKQKAFCLAVGAEHIFPGAATSWSIAVDQLAYNNGNGRIICVSVGNTRNFGKLWMGDRRNIAA